jgi:hypothetical protein
MRNLLFIILLSIFICSCALPVSKRLVPFNEAQLLPYTSAGNSKIVGQAFLKTQGGDVKYGAGNNVYIEPDTAYSSEGLERELNHEILEPVDERYKKYLKFTVADGQ